MLVTSRRRVPPFLRLLFGGALALAIAGCAPDRSVETSGDATTGSAGAGAGAGNGTGGQGGGGSAGSSGSGEGGGLAVGCQPACAPPQICSVAKACIDPGTCLDDGDCGAGTVCDLVAKQCVPGGCGAQEAKAEAVPPNLLIVLDRSCSMTKKVGAVSKWQIAVDALVKLTTTQNGKIRFGLALFPDLDAPKCAQAAIPVPVAPATEGAIQSLLTASLAANDPWFPDGPCVTNIDTAMQQAAGEPALADPERESYVLLLTDGKQAGCSDAGGDEGTTKILGDLYAAGVATFVVGFGSEVDPAQLNLFAEAGGVPANDPNAPDVKFYKAEDQATLDAALAAIAKKTLGCQLTLDEVPPNPNEVYVFFDDVESVPNDPTQQNGWTYDPATNQVTFHGPACEKLQKGEVTDVDIVFGCDEPTPN